MNGPTRNLILVGSFLLSATLLFAQTPEADERFEPGLASERGLPLGLVVPPSVARGEVLRAFVVVPTGVGIDSISGRLARRDGYEVGAHGWRIASTDYEGELWQILFGIESGLAPGDAEVYAAIALEDGRTMVLEERFDIVMRSFRDEEIPLNYALTTLRTSEDEQKVVEARELWALLQATDLEARFHPGRFIYPLAEFRRTSLFGDRRRYRYSDGTRVPSLHNGLDMAAPTGTLIVASGRGRVALAQSRIVTGNTVVLEHQPGVYSMYYHLDRIDVERGAIVGQGDVIGTVGSTGLSTGPHLHWEVRVSGVAVDPEWFISAPLVDTHGVDGALSLVP